MSTQMAYLPWRQPKPFRERSCVRDETHDLTYAEFATWVDAVAEQLGERGVKAGDVVGIMLPNRVELLVAMVATWRLGAAATPINPVFTNHEASYQINDADCAIVVNLGPDKPDGGRPSITVDELRHAPSGDTVFPETQPNTVALLIYTSGSTGRPKGVILDHANIDAMSATMAEHLHLSDDDHCLLVLPLFHANAIMVSFLTMMRLGAQLSILERFQPAAFLQAIERLRPTYFSGVPTIYSHLVSQPEDVVADVSSVRFAICGAAPASKELLDATQRRLGFPLIEGYGLTEGTCASAVNPVDGPRKLGSVGIALPGQTIEVMSPAGDILPTGERGEVVIKGPTVMRGYLNRPEATAETLRDGWLHTGDVGVIDEDGYLTLVDRIKDMIIRGGENIYPKEIEAALQAHPQVLEAAVVGIPDERYGEVPVAYVVTYPGADLQVDDLVERCREHLTKVKLPAAIHILESLPKNPVGKIDKPTLRTLQH